MNINKSKYRIIWIVPNNENNNMKRIIMTLSNQDLDMNGIRMIIIIAYGAVDTNAIIIRIIMVMTLL